MSSTYRNRLLFDVYWWFLVVRTRNSLTDAAYIQSHIVVPVITRTISVAADAAVLKLTISSTRCILKAGKEADTKTTLSYTLLYNGQFLESYLVWSTQNLFLFRIYPVLVLLIFMDTEESLIILSARYSLWILLSWSSMSCLLRMISWYARPISYAP